MRGYDYAVEKAGLGSPDPFLAEFRDWVHRRFGTTARSWEDAILSQSGDEVAAVQRFWELLDEYLEETTPSAGAKKTTAAKAT